MENLGHIISATRVSADPKKIHSMETWPIPSNTTTLRGVLRLTGYYQKFIQRYGAIVAPLTWLLKKDGFHWTPEAEKVFHNLKQAITQAPVLILPYFSKLFVVEADASRIGLGVVLIGKGRLVAYYGKAISRKALG